MDFKLINDLLFLSGVSQSLQTQSRYYRVASVLPQLRHTLMARSQLCWSKDAANAENGANAETCL